MGVPVSMLDLIRSAAENAHAEGGLITGFFLVTCDGQSITINARAHPDDRVGIAVIQALVEYAQKPEVTGDTGSADAIGPCQGAA